MLEDLVKKSKNIIFIDGSYFCFYLYYSMINWWKNTYPLQEDVLKNPYENDIFREKFISRFIQSVDEIVNKLLIYGVPNFFRNINQEEIEMVSWVNRFLKWCLKKNYFKKAEQI